MSHLVFQHSVSKGSKFNQIYIPSRYSLDFEVGDVVEVKLLQKKKMIFYSKNIKKLPDFKEKIIREIFSILPKSERIEQVIVFGSFLTKDVDYNDLDILLLGKEEIEEQAYKELTEKLKLKFHVISARKDNLLKALEICPVTRGMLYYFVSNKAFSIPSKITFDKNHIMYLLMMPEDLLRVKFSSGRVYYDALRKLISIESFLEMSETTPDKIDGRLSKVLDERILQRLKDDLVVSDDIVRSIRKIIGKKIKKIRKLIKKWENRKK